MVCIAHPGDPGPREETKTLESNQKRFRTQVRPPKRVGRPTSYGGVGGFSPIPMVFERPKAVWSVWLHGFCICRQVWSITSSHPFFHQSIGRQSTARWAPKSGRVRIRGGGESRLLARAHWMNPPNFPKARNQFWVFSSSDPCRGPQNPLTRLFGSLPFLSIQCKATVEFGPVASCVRLDSPDCFLRETKKVTGYYI